MAPKDYVSRKPTPKKKPSAPKKPVPLVAVALALVVIAGFVIALLFLNQQPSVEPPSTHTTLPEPDALPQVPEEKWEYVESLPNQTVPVEVPEQEVSNKRYRLQCASLKVRADAETLKARLAFQGLSAKVEETNGSNGKWFRVVLGPYESKRQAERDRHAARRADVLSCQMLELKI